jgi:TonB family protein
MQSGIVTLSFLLLLFLSGQPFGSRQPRQGRQLPTTPENQPEEAVRLSKLVRELYALGKYDEALPQAKRVVEIDEAAFGPSDPRVAVALVNVAELYVAKKDLGNAVKILQRAVTIYDNSPKRDSVEAGIVLERLGAALYDWGEYKKAAPFLERSLAISEQAPGKDELTIAEILWRLAHVRVAEGQYRPAEHLFLRSLDLREKKLGPSHPQTVAAMKSFACFQPGIYERGVSYAQHEAEFTDEEKAIGYRAGCWRDGFKDDCDSTFGKPPAKRESAKPLNGKAIKFPVPPYPAEARSARASGAIMLAVTIDEAGKVINAKSVCGGHPALVRAALAAAGGAQFSPAQIDGKPGKVNGTIVYRFVGQ